MLARRPTPPGQHPTSTSARPNDQEPTDENETPGNQHKGWQSCGSVRSERPRCERALTFKRSTRRMVPDVRKRWQRDRRELAAASSKRNGQEADAPRNRQQETRLSRLTVSLAATCSATSCKMLRRHVRCRHQDKQDKNYEPHEHTHLFLDGSLYGRGSERAELVFGRTWNDDLSRDAIVVRVQPVRTTASGRSTSRTPRTASPGNQQGQPPPCGRVRRSTAPTFAPIVVWRQYHACSKRVTPAAARFPLT